MKEWLGELKCSRAAEETATQQLQLLQQKVVQLQQELATEVAAAAAGAQQIKELNELNVKLSGHNNQQQVTDGDECSAFKKMAVCNTLTLVAEDPLSGGAEEGGKCAEGGSREGKPGGPELPLCLVATGMRFDNCCQELMQARAEAERLKQGQVLVASAAFVFATESLY